MVVEPAVSCFVSRRSRRLQKNDKYSIILMNKESDLLLQYKIHTGRDQDRWRECVVDYGSFAVLEIPSLLLRQGQLNLILGNLCVT